MATLQIASSDVLRSIRRIQCITITWMIVEAALSLWTAWRAHSPALAAFGGDSVIELLSAVVVFWRFRNPGSESAEHNAARITGVLLITLAAFVACVSARALLGYSEPRPSYLGIGVLAAAALIMPQLAREKRSLSAQTGSAALRADAAESALCAYLSFIALAGLVTHALFHIEWADPIAALAILPFILYEARQALRGKPCGCC